jgi:EmrB/QacA subfamily drug resistance transporter
MKEHQLRPVEVNREQPVVHASATPKSEFPSNSGPWILTATILGSCMVFIDGTVVNVALSAIQAAFHTTGSTLQWIVEAYVLFLASFLLLGGSFGDLYGRRKIFLLGVVLFGAASISCGFAQNFGVIILSRALQGIGGALLVPGSLALISASFPEERRGRAIGIWSGSTAIAAMVGPVLGGWLVQNISWRWIFFLNVPLAVTVIVISIGKVPESRNPRATRPDWIGASLAALGLGLCAFALVESTHTLAIGVAGLSCLAGFVFWESRTDQPMMPLVLFCSRSFTIANLITLFIYAALTGTLYYLPLYLIQVQRYSATRAGAALLPIGILISILSRFTGGFVARFGPRRPLAAGALLSALSYALLLRVNPDGNYWTTIFPGVCLLGFALAVLVAPLTTTVMNSVGENRSGAASGINNAISNVASLLAISVFGILVSGAFGRALLAKLVASSLSAAAQQTIYAHRLELGGMAASVGPLGQTIVDAAFAHALHLVLIVSSLLSLAAAIASISLRDEKVTTANTCDLDAASAVLN